MKTYILFILALMTTMIIACNDEINKMPTSKLVETIRGGCADGLPPSGAILWEKSDTVYHYIKDNFLYVYVGFNATCCILFDDNAKMTSDEIELSLNEISDDQCDCMCWYEFTFKFTGFENKLYNYYVKVDGKLKFSGQIDLRE